MGEFRLLLIGSRIKVCVLRDIDALSRSQGIGRGNAVRCRDCVGIYITKHAGHGVDRIPGGDRKVGRVCPQGAVRRECIAGLGDLQHHAAVEV